MNRSSREVDLSFLNGEEARQILKVLERDSQLKKAERERLSKLQKKKEDPAGFSGEWFEDIPKRKCQSDTDVSRMLKQPLAHPLKKAIGNDSANTKGSALQIPQAQKHGSSSILEGLKTPFASLLSSFKKSKKQHVKPLQKQPQNSLQYDHLTTGAHTSFKAEEMATTQTCNSSLPSQPTNKCLDANIADRMNNTSTWNEELENELLKVLDSLDNQLAEEQSQDTMNRRTPTDSGSTVPEIHQHSIVMQPDFLGEIQRNGQTLFLPDRTRTLRSRDKYKTFFRPRKLYDTYMKQHHTEKFTYRDLYDKSSSVLKRGYSTCSLGRSSEDSLELPSGSHNSAFGPKNLMSKNTMGRSYSLSCLTRHSSLMSVDKFSTSGLQHGLESSMDFTEAKFQQHFRRTPLSSIVWNMPQSSRHSLHPGRLRRTQSLTEFNSPIEDTHPCSPVENTRYKFYKSKMNYRKVMPNASHSLFTDRHIDPLCFDNRENYVSHSLKRNLSKSCYRYPSFHGKMNLSQNKFPFERTEDYLFRCNNHQYDGYHVPDVNFKHLPNNLSDRQSDYGKKKDVWQTEHVHNHASEYTRTRDHPGRGTSKLFLKCAKGMHKCPTYFSAALENQTEYAAPSRSQFSGDSQAPSKAFAKSFQTKRNSKILGMEEVSGADQSDRADSMDIKNPILSQVFGQVNTNNPTESQVSPSTVFSLPTPPTSSSLQPPFMLNSKRQAKANSLRHIENICLSNIHSRKGQRNEDNCAESSVEQTCSPRLIANPTKLSVLQSYPQEEHPLETLKAFNPNGMLNRSYLSVFSEDSKLLPNNESPVSYAETGHKLNRFIKYSTSNSISGSPSSSPLKSPITYNILHRKSASTDGSDLCKKRISPPTRKIPFGNKRTEGDNLEARVSDKIGNIYSNKGDKNSLLHSSYLSLNISPKEMVDEKNKQIKDYHMQLTQVPNCPSGSTNIIGSKRKKEDDILGPEKTAISVLSEKEETEAGNPLKQYKTTSTLTVSIEEDNVKYHELISVYYTLPRKHSKTLCNIFLEDTKKTESSSCPEKPQTPQKEYEVRIGMATVAFPPSLEKGEKVVSDKMSAPPHIQQDSKNAGNCATDLQFPNPTVETTGTSQALHTMHNREEMTGAGAEGPALAISNRPAVNGSSGDPKASKTEDETVNIVTSPLSNLRTGRHSSPRTEASKLDKALHFNSLNSKNTKISLRNISAVSPATSVQKGSPCCDQPSAEASASIPPSNLTDIIQDGKSTAYLEASSPVNASREKNRNAAEIKESARYICRIISERGHRFQPRNESVRNEASIPKIQMHSDSQNSTLPGDASFPVNPVIQPNGNMVECSNPPQQELTQNPLLQKVGANSQRPERISVNNQNLSSKDQHSSTAQELPEHSLPENKLALDCSKDKVSDIEKRKNRSSIKNKLAAMYKTSRKFSSKKSSTSKPHVSCIFSQNDALSLDNSSHHPVLISPDDSQQTENENQNQASLPGEFDITRLSKVENKKLQANEDPLLPVNEMRRPFTNLCNQKREHSGQSEKNKKTTQNSTVLFPKPMMPVLNNSLQTGSKVLENNNHPIFSKCIVMDSYPPKRGQSNVGEPSSFPLLSDKHSYIKNDSKANIYPLQKWTSQTECDSYQDNEQSDIFKNVNQPCVKPFLTLSKTQRERHFSESSYTQKLHDHLTPKSSLTQPGYSRKFKSYSELLSCDENENWDTYENNQNFGSRRIMYPSIEFGIFGKEQQQAFLDNIKRSLTEGRLWNPCLLKNPRSIKKEVGYSLSGLELLKSSAAEEQFPNEPLDFHEEGSTYSSDSDSDTTTDDEYYLHEYEKESEL